MLRKRRGSGPVLAGLTCERMDDGLRAFARGGKMAARFARWYLKTIYVPQLDVHIATSRYTASELPFNARHPRPVYVRPMGVDTSTFTLERRSHGRRAALRAREDLASASATPSWRATRESSDADCDRRDPSRRSEPAR